MATVSDHDPRIHENEHPVFMHAFDGETRRSLIDDDLFAGRSVSAVLVAIVTMGLAIGILTTFLTM